MTWVRFDDQYPIHDKVEDLSDAAFRLNTQAIFWCSRNTTDGFVRERKLTSILPRARNHARIVAELVAAGLWDPVEGGWFVHDYLDFQPSKAKVQADRKAAAERQQRMRDKRGSHSVTTTVTPPVTDDVTSTVTNATPSRPVPSRPKEQEQDSLRSSSARKRATRIPEDFTVTPHMVEWARQRTPHVDGRVETEKFINYWQAKAGKDASKRDWAATWRNWMLTAAERVPTPNGHATRLATADQRVLDVQALKHSPPLRVVNALEIQS